MSAFEMKPRNSAPSAAPTTVPDPPKMLTPPTTTAATTWSVTPVAAVALIVPNWMPHRTPAMPASRPQTENDDERHEAGPDAEDLGRLGVAADRVDRAAEPRLAQDDGDDGDDRDRDRARRAGCPTTVARAASV